MNTNKKLNILFIQEKESLLDVNSNMFEQLFNTVKKIQEEEVLSLLDSNQYDMVIGDLTINTDKIVVLKKIKDKNPQQIVFALLSPKDSDKLYSIANLDINAFELIPVQFDQALQAIAEFH